MHNDSSMNERCGSLAGRNSSPELNTMQKLWDELNRPRLAAQHQGRTSCFCTPSAILWPRRVTHLLLLQSLPASFLTYWFGVKKLWQRGPALLMDQLTGRAHKIIFQIQEHFETEDCAHRGIHSFIKQYIKISHISRTKIMHQKWNTKWSVLHAACWFKPEHIQYSW